MLPVLQSELPLAVVAGGLVLLLLLLGRTLFGGDGKYDDPEALD